MIVERTIDCAALYERERRALVDVVRALTDEQRATTVPATPAWSVQDALAHVVGIAASLNAGDVGPGDADAWTAAQVEGRRGRSVDELAAEWDAEAPVFEDGLRLFGYELGSHFLGDLLQHVADVRHAVGLPRPADDDALLVALDFYLDSFHRSLLDAGVGTVVVDAAGDEWTLGTGGTVATVRAGRYELFRALGGRRTLDQIRSLTWTGEPERIVRLVSRYGVPDTPIVEP